MRVVIAALGCFVLVIVGFVVFVPTVIIGLDGGFHAREMQSVRSSDGGMRVVVTKRVPFGALDWVDPSVVIQAELRRSGTDEIVAWARVDLIEDSDFGPATVQWNPGEVRVTGFDRRRDRAMTLRYPADSSLQPGMQEVQE